MLVGLAIVMLALGFVVAALAAAYLFICVVVVAGIVALIIVSPPLGIGLSMLGYLGWLVHRRFVRRADR